MHRAWAMNRHKHSWRWNLFWEVIRRSLTKCKILVVFNTLWNPTLSLPKIISIVNNAQLFSLRFQTSKFLLTENRTHLASTHLIWFLWWAPNIWVCSKCLKCTFIKSFFSIGYVKWIYVSSFFLSKSTKLFIAQSAVTICIHIVENLIDIFFGQFDLNKWRVNY